MESKPFTPVVSTARDYQWAEGLCQKLDTRIASEPSVRRGLLAFAITAVRDEERERVAALIEAVEDQRFGATADIAAIAAFIRTEANDSAVRLPRQAEGA